MKKKKLLFIMPTMGGGGAERVLINLLNLLDYKVYDVDFIVLMGKGELWDSIPQSVNKTNTDFPPLLIKGINFIFRKTHINLFGLLGKKVKGNYDVGISFMDSIFTELLLIKSLHLDKKIAVMHSSYKSYSNRSKFIQGKYKEIIHDRYSKLDHIVAVSQESKIEFVELFGDQYPVEVIYNPMDIRDVLLKSIDSVPNDLKSDEFHFVAIGSLLPVKDFQLLIRAAAILKDSNYNFQLHILGEGELRNELTDLIKSEGLESRVSLLGFVKNPYPWIKNADVFVMSSIVEGLPTVLCESLILGKPVIVPNVPGCREVIDHGKYGVMCERDDNEFYQAMARFIDEPKLLEIYSEKALERSKIFSDVLAVEKYNELFQG